VVHRVLVLCSLISCTLVFASFALFAHDQVAGASQRQQTALVSPSAAVIRAPARHHRPGQPRRFIDSAAGTLTAPFDAIVHSSDQWVTRGLPAVLGLLTYGIGLRALARYAEGAKI
jgi:hypothetical protein